MPRMAIRRPTEIRRTLFLAKRNSFFPLGSRFLLRNEQNEEKATCTDVETNERTEEIL